MEQPPNVTVTVVTGVDAEWGASWLFPEDPDGQNYVNQGLADPVAERLRQKNKIPANINFLVILRRTDGSVVVSDPRLMRTIEDRFERFTAGFLR